MALARFFAAGRSDGDVLPLSVSDVHHATGVLRLAPGEEVAVVGEDGVARVFALTEVTRGALSGRLVRTVQRPWLPSVTLGMAIGKGDKGDLVVEKAVELGVERVVLLQTERTVVRLNAERAARRIDRLTRVCGSAARQSQRFEIPPIEGPMSVDAFAATVHGYDRVLVAWEEHEGEGISGALDGCSHDARVAVVVGPEGGLTSAEMASLVGAGARAVSLGPTILRTETAAIVATALAMAALGGLGSTTDGE